MQQQMPGPPNISFTDGQLTVTANNSTVQDVINGIHSATGTKFVVQGGPTQERLFGRFGPGSVSLVLAQILKGSNFGYILISDPEKPALVQTAMLMPAAAASAPAQQVVQQNPNGQQFQQQPAQEIPPDQAAEDETPAPEPSPEVPPQGGQQQFPVQINNGQYPQANVNQGNQQANPNDPNQPKTPEQLLQELQRLQQMRIQQQQQQQQPQNPQ